MRERCDVLYKDSGKNVSIASHDYRDIRVKYVILLIVSSLVVACRPRTSCHVSILAQRIGGNVSPVKPLGMYASR